MMEIVEYLYIDFDDYEKIAMSTAEYPDVGDNIVYPAMGCAGEAGEFADKIKKHWRNTGSLSSANMTPEQRIAAAKELGDQLWYVNAAAKELGFSLHDIAKMNLQKLLDRRARGVIRSTGDNR
jgi:NTP pyrophosphatase (non-canonical NTP hydrolase)